jgi:NTE family protein
MPKADLVLEGGGAKGVGLVGAVRQLMRKKYVFPRVAGTSAGSIVAAFLAAGITEDELTDVMERLQYPRVPDRAPPGIPLLSEGISLFRKRGAFQGDYIRDFLYEELKKLHVTTFADLRRTDRGADKNLGPYHRYKLVVMATDITRGRLLRLPWDYPLLNLEADEQLVADAVRASISIPLYFEPVTISHGNSDEETTLVDGGVLTNFPIEIFDRTDAIKPRFPTFGVKIIPNLPAGNAQLFPAITLPRVPPVHLLEQVVATAIFGNDQTYLERPCVARRAIHVDTSAVGVVEFNAAPEKRAALMANGEEAVEQFLKTWDWKRYKRECRGVTDEK